MLDGKKIHQTRSFVLSIPVYHNSLIAEFHLRVKITFLCRHAHAHIESVGTRVTLSGSVFMTLPTWWEHFHYTNCSAQYFTKFAANRMNFLSSQTHRARQAKEKHKCCDKIFHSLSAPGWLWTRAPNSTECGTKSDIYKLLCALKNTASKKLLLIDGSLFRVCVYICAGTKSLPGASLASRVLLQIRINHLLEKYRRLNISIKCGLGVFARRRLIWSPSWKMVHKQPAAAAKGLQRGFCEGERAAPMGSIVALEIVCTRIKKGLDAIAQLAAWAGKLLNP